MIVVDANLLLYAYDAASPSHERAKEWLEGVLAGPEPVRFPLACLLAFVRIGTDPRVFDDPLTPGEAIGHVAVWLEPVFAAVATPTHRHWAVLADTMTAGQARGSQTTDAHLAALTLEHGGVLYTADRGFARYPGLRFVDPLSSV